MKFRNVIPISMLFSSINYKFLKFSFSWFQFDLAHLHIILYILKCFIHESVKLIDFW